MPVSLFLEEIKLGGALEPTEVIYNNIASELVARGLALPIRKYVFYILLFSFSCGTTYHKHIHFQCNKKFPSSVFCIPK